MPEKLTSSDIATVLRLIRKGDKALLDKKKALADLGYGSERNVDAELKKTNDYRGSRGLPPLDLSSKNYKYVGNRQIVSKPDTTSVEVNRGDEDFYQFSSKYLDDDGEISISPDPETVEYNEKINGLLRGDVLTAESALGHELTHDLTKSENPFNVKLGKSAEDHAIYPEYNPREFAPPLAAMTRLEYQQTGNRIDTPEKFDKKIAEYDAMSSEEKLAFRKKLPVEVSRFYGYLDAVSDPKAKDIYLQGPENDELPLARYARTNTGYHGASKTLRDVGITIKDYDDMTAQQRVAFKKGLRDRKAPRTTKAANYLDGYDKFLKRSLKDNYLKKHGLKGGEKAPVKVEGKDRRKRFLDISREMIPSLVEKDESFEEAINRRMS